MESRTEHSAALPRPKTDNQTETEKNKMKKSVGKKPKIDTG
jgi:hypothetical protein